MCLWSTAAGVRPWKVQASIGCPCGTYWNRILNGLWQIRILSANYPTERAMPKMPPRLASVCKKPDTGQFCSRRFAATDAAIHPPMLPPDQEPCTPRTTNG